MMHVLGKIVWIITALVSMNVGTSALFGFDALASLPVDMAKLVAILIGVAGVLSLVMMFKGCRSCKCGDVCTCSTMTKP